MQNKGFEDRRIFQRFPVSLSLRFLDRSLNKWGLAQACDISAKGVGLAIERELPIRTPLEVWLEIPNRGESYYTTGKVAWIEPLELNKYRAGVSLERLDFIGIAQILREIR